MKKIQLLPGTDLLQEKEPVLLEQLDLSCFDDFNTVTQIINKLANAEVTVTMKVITADNVSATYSIPYIGQINTYADLLSRKGSKFIFYISKIESHHSCIGEIRKKLTGENEYQKMDAVLSLSFPGSAAFQKPHVDAFNVVIIQLAGKRNWTIWDSSRQHEFYLYGHPETMNSRSADELQESPLNQLTLCPGQFLYIPAYYPHFAVAAGDRNDAAISIAISWKNL